MLKSTVFYLCIIVCAASAAADAQESKLVHIAQGPVRGYKDPDTGVYFFQSIPYASVPTGSDRFKVRKKIENISLILKWLRFHILIFVLYFQAPLPPPTWMDPLEAVSQNIACPQAELPIPGLPELNQQENCLITSVYVPDTQENNLPVVVYVHGGAFQLGAGDWIKPTKLVAENNIISVTFNYRLGTHGFLCLGTEDVPGNAGMKDQVAALRWVKKNIASFGGNPNDVTIQGSSAGSAAVDLLMLSKSAEGLFDKVIPESGASIAPWTIQSDPLENAKRNAKYLNFTNVDDIYALEHFYKTASFKQITSLPFFHNPDSIFGPSPCVERPTGADIFLDKSPVDILKSGNYRKVPLLYGFANMEGLLRIDIFDSFKYKMNEEFSDFLPADLKFESRKQKQDVAKQAKKFYFSDKPVGEDTILSYIDYFTDVIFAYPMLRTVKYHVEAGHDQIYLYDYSFVDNNTPVVPYTEVKGANHCAQTEAVFGGMQGFLDLKESTDEFKKMSSTINKIWGSFIKTG